MHARYSHTYAALPERFHAAVHPTAVRAPTLIAWNDALAAELGIDVTAIDPAQLARYCAGNEIPPGARPLAMAYAGHQFGRSCRSSATAGRCCWARSSIADGRRRDLQLKGAGQTPYSRRGDGRAALGPMLREYLVSEAMHALGIPTTRALAAVATGEHVLREDGPLPGGVLIRVAASHVRVGTFEYFAAREDVDRRAAARRPRHRPALPGAARARRTATLALLEAVAERQAALVARWLQVGFIHGVMNTDNMTISGETIDYGPCAFMDDYDPATVFSSIDRGGRYAYGNQPHILQWNLARLAETLLPLLDADTGRAVERATAIVDGFPARFAQHWLDGFRAQARPGHGRRRTTSRCCRTCSRLMQQTRADFTNTFRGLAAVAEGQAPAAAGLRGLDRALAGARGARGSRPAAPWPRAAARRQPGLHPAQPPGRGGTGRGRRARRLRAFPSPAASAGHAVRRPAGSGGIRRPLPAAHERVRNTFCGT